MPKQARPIKPVAKKKKTKPKPSTKVEPFRFILFNDLHVNNETIDQACELLDIVAAKAVEHDADVVCLGDFWDIRGTLNVRQLDRILQRVENIIPAGEGEKIFIPGNHDQVTLDGTVHGMNVFRGYSDIHVTTTRWQDLRGCMFVPWREKKEDQRKIFELPTGQWTVFGHAEVEGAVANSGKRASGLVTAKQIEKVARACYLGHYHKRQRIGDRIWYIGSPYQLDMGERDQPHGIALVTHEQIEPTWIDIDKFPRYWRLNFGKAWDLSEIKENDIVEVQATPEELAHPSFTEAIAEIPAIDIRSVPVEVPKDQAPPAFALKLDDAIEAYVNQELESVVHPFDELEITALGKDILSGVPEAKTLPPLGTEVSLLEMTLKDFCVIPGEFTINIADMKRALITGPIGIGKTAIADASMWCLYGATTPRKAGQVGATLRADDVINDYADQCLVSCKVKVKGFKKVITITRTKQRGKGSTISIEGGEVKAGISDQQQLVRHIIGYDQSLWRACVCLGQGAVANFATDADKRRKDQLSSAFGLEACPAAQKVAKKRLDAVNAILHGVKQQQIVSNTQKETLEGQDFKVASERWELEKKAELDALVAAGNESKSTIEQCEKLLKGEASWLESKKLHDQRVDNITKQLAELRPTKRIAELQRQYGALEAEKSIIERDRNNAQVKLNALIEQSNKGVAICGECGQALPTGTIEQHMSSHESLVKSKATEFNSFKSRLVNIATELDALNTSGTKELEQFEIALQESRLALGKCDEALPQFTRIRANWSETKNTLEKARKDYTVKEAVKNPFVKQAELNRTKIEELTAKLKELSAEIIKLAAEKDQLTFWVEGFSAKGLPVLVLRTVLYELETSANSYLSKMLDGKIYTQLKMDGDDLRIQYFEWDSKGKVQERTYEKLSGGQRRCVELAFAPFALSDLIFNRCGVKINLLTLDELTTHLGETQKKRVCEILESLDRTNILAIDHDTTVQGYFDTLYELRRTETEASLHVVT